MKKLIAAALCIVMLAGLLSACGSHEEADSDLHIITTIFPIYDWVNEILGDTGNAEVTLLLDSGVDLHNYQLTADDMIQISSCDVFLYVGGESDAWVEDALAGAVNENMIVINLLEVLGDKAKEEEVVEGMQSEQEEHGEAEYDEHVWLSLKNAAFFCRYIAERLGEAAPESRAVYERNAAAYADRLSALDAEYQQAADGAPRNTVLFGDRFPFRYLMDDYGLEYYAAFSGCSAETEASFETITFLAGKVDELNLAAILQIESSDGSIPDTIRQSTAAKNQEILTMDSMQSTTAEDVAGGVTYLAVMENNLGILRQALK